MTNSTADILSTIVKNKFEEDEQKFILSEIIKEAKKLTISNQIQQRIKQAENEIKENNLKTAISKISLFLAELEDTDDGKKVINHLKNKGLFRILYHHPKSKGLEVEEDDVLRNLLRNGYIGVGIAALLIVFFATSALFGAPFWVIAIATGLFVGTSIYLGGLLYAVVNDLFATHSNLPYFLLGHQPQQVSLFKTN